MALARLRASGELIRPDQWEKVDISSFSHAPYEKAAELLFSLFVGKVWSS